MSSLRRTRIYSVYLVSCSVTVSYGYAMLASQQHAKGKASPYSITERRVPELIPVLGSQPAGDVSHKPGSRLPLFSASRLDENN